jgi:FAD/FMN-containing dehydrogenase
MAALTDLPRSLSTFSGELLHPGDEGYENARRVHNGLVDKRPALIARCHGVADVLAAVACGRELGLELAIRGGGHNVAGKAVTDGGLTIDLSPMRGVLVDPARRTARAQGGVTWAELDRETQLHGLAVTGGIVSSTGIAGLTLGGGFGWTMNAFGLAADNLVSAEVVTADGRVLEASEQENADLLWALRGGGGNFGVVTSFEYALHPVGPTVTGGMVVHPFEAAGELFRGFRKASASFPDELTAIPALLHAADGSGAPLAAIACCHVGRPDAAQRDLRGILDLGSPLDVQVGPMPYTAVNAMLDGAFPRGALNYWKSSFLEQLSDSAIDMMISQFAAAPSPMTSLALEHFHGAVTRISIDSAAVPHREAGYNLIVTSVWTEPEATDVNVAWTRETFEGLRPAFADRRYVNYLDSDDGAGDAVRAAYGPNYDRLARIKAEYDPDNVFHLNQNIKPTPSA